MPDPSLVAVSALFLLSVAAVLYLGAWAFATATLRVLRAHLSHTTAKRVLLSALWLPPLLASLMTVSGATLGRMSGSGPEQHHSVWCAELFGLPPLGGSPFWRDAAGAVLNGGAWLFLLTGIYLAVRLFRATAELERGLVPFQSPPSPRLEATIARVARAVPQAARFPFYECPIPASCSSVIGFRRPRCVLSQEFVAAADDDELDAVVAHEASHLRAGDVRATFLVGVLNCLFFYLRPVQLLGRRWREEAELACDDAAVAATRKPLAMASAILRVSGALRAAGTSVASSELPAVALPFADGVACSPDTRVERLLSQAERAALLPTREPASRAVGGWLATGTLAAAGVTLLISAQAQCLAHCVMQSVARLFP